MLALTTMDYKDFKLAVILSIDIPGLSLGGTGEEEDADLTELCHGIAMGAAGSNNGTVTKAIGDSFILSFANSLDAVRCAMEIREKLRESSKGSDGVSEKTRLLARMGIHLGEVYFFENDAFGDAINAATALRAAARPGRICISGDILSLIRDRMPLNAVALSDKRQKALPPGMTAFEIETDSARPAQESPGAKTDDAPQSDSGSPAKEQAATSADSRKDENPDSLRVSIRKAILEEIRTRGRRLTVDEAMEKYGYYGIEATEVIASLADAGILIGKSRAQPPRQLENPGPENAGTYAPQSSSDIGKSIESAVHSIVSEIERAVRNSTQNSRAPGEEHEGQQSISIHINKDRRARRRQGRYGDADYAVVSGFQKYREELVLKAGKLKRSLPQKIVAFLAVNAGLWYLNLHFSGNYPWAVFVSLFWGFGVLDSLISSVRASRQGKEAEALPDIDERQTKELKAINKKRDSLGDHFMSTLTISSALFLINQVTQPQNPWYAIPAGILVASFLIHSVTYLTTMPGRIKKFFEKTGIRGGKKGLREAYQRQAAMKNDMGAYAALFREAQDSASDIEEALSKSDPSSVAEMKPQLEGYLNQVLLLAQTAHELDSIINEIPMEALRKDKASLSAKLKEAPPDMRQEYEGSIKEIEKQEVSFMALKDQREVIDLRLRSSINQLHQLKMDLARARAADKENEAAGSDSALSSIRARAEELSHYIEDLKEGHLEALKDPFLELEEKYGKGPPPQAGDKAEDSSAPDH